MSKYDSLPEAPSEISAANILMRMVDGLGFRYAYATNGLTQDFFDYSCCESSMSGGQLMKHIYQLSFWIGTTLKIELKYDKTIETVDGYRNATLAIIEKISDRISGITNKELQETQLYLKRTDTHYSFWFLINGPIADALTHVGQILTWRRMAGNPIERISPLSGKLM